jgi:DinB family
MLGRRSFLASISPGSGAAMMLEHLRRMARYNAWANRRLYEACAQLPEVEYRRPCPAFFGSIHGTQPSPRDRLDLARAHRG